MGSPGFIPATLDKKHNYSVVSFGIGSGCLELSEEEPRKMVGYSTSAHPGPKLPQLEAEEFCSRVEKLVSLSYNHAAMSS